MMIQDLGGGGRCVVREFDSWGAGEPTACIQDVIIQFKRIHQTSRLKIIYFYSLADKRSEN